MYIRKVRRLGKYTVNNGVVDVKIHDCLRIGDLNFGYLTLYLGVRGLFCATEKHRISP